MTYDGHVVDAGVRLKGGTTFLPLSEKPSFSVQFNEFDEESHLLGLKKILLNNSMVQGQYRVHFGRILGHEVYRRAGLPAPLTAVAQVSLNGHPYGIYVVTEAKNKQFLARNFGGTKLNDGNLYEGGSGGGVDFVRDPYHSNIELKDEIEEGRNREGLVNLANTAFQTPNAQWASALREKFELDDYIRAFALDAMTNHGDDYSFHPGCNYFLYHQESNGKFAFITHGMNRTMLKFEEYDMLSLPPKAVLAQKVLEISETKALYDAALMDIATNAWDVPALIGIVEQTMENIHSTTFTDELTLEDLEYIDYLAERTRAFIPERRAVVLSQLK